MTRQFCYACRYIGVSARVDGDGEMPIAILGWSPHAPSLGEVIRFMGIDEVDLPWVRPREGVVTRVRKTSRFGRVYCVRTRPTA